MNKEGVQSGSGSRAAGGTIALWPKGGRDWVAGHIYSANLTRALLMLPEEERVSSYLIVPQTTTVAELRELGGEAGARHFSFYEWDPTAEKLRLAARSLTRLQWPMSMEWLLVSTKARVVFPAIDSLGREFPVPWVSWIPDYQYRRIPQFFSAGEQAALDNRFKRVVAEAAHNVVSSEDALADLMRWTPTDPSRVSILPFVSVAGDDWYAEDPAAVAARHGLPEKYLIFPSQFWVHKNHRVLYEAIAILRDGGIRDICVVNTGFQGDYRWPSHFGELQQLIEERGIRANVRMPGFLPRAEQIHLVRRAAAVVQPSLFEGWSLLVEDARTLGKRIYLTDLAIHREQKPPDAVYFDATNAEQLAELIAADWEGLKPGPDLAREKEARAGHEVRAVEFARKFLQIVDKAANVEWHGRMPSGRPVRDVVKKIARRALRSVRDGLDEQVLEQMAFNRLGRKRPELMWQACARCPQARAEGGIVAMGDRLYLMGGFERLDLVVNVVNVFDLRKQRWTGQFKMPAGMGETHFSLAGDDERYVYTAGGQTGPECGPGVATCFVLDTATNTWAGLPDLPAPRYAPTAKLWNGRLHVTGGSLPDRCTPAREHWSIAVKDGRAMDESWREEPAVPVPATHRGSAVVGDRLYVFGGHEGDLGPVPGDPCFKCDVANVHDGAIDDVFLLENGATEWKRLASIPRPRGHIDNATIPMGAQAAVIGGVESHTEYSDLIHVYDTRTDKWRVAGKLPYGMKTSAVCHKGWLYLGSGQRVRSEEDHSPGAVLNSMWRARFEVGE